MSLLEQPRRDPVDFIPDDHDVDSHDHDQESYRSSCSSSPRPSTPATPHSEIDVFEKPNTEPNDKTMTSDNTKDDALLVPAVPARSSLRASRLLATLPDKLESEERPVLPPAAPHLLYLSSEEDASSSADDFSDCDYSSDSESSEHGQLQYKDIARIVSVVFSGKPSIIELPRRSISPKSSSSARPLKTELHRTSTEPILSRKGSATSLTSFQHPPRSSSMLTNFDTQRHSFLNVDPFASKPEVPEEREGQQNRKPTMFKRTLSLVRKRSKPALNTTSISSREGLTIQPVRMQQVGEGKTENHTSQPRAMTPRSASTSYHEAMSSMSSTSSARKTSYSAATSPTSETSSPISPSKRLRQGFMSRRKSIKV